MASVALDPAKFAAHALRERKLFCHSTIESTVRYLRIEVDDAIEIAEKIDI